ncbi:hypothetical protein AGMMS49525_10420 [Bacteroidia bacterium]|nr:hypothetical protein AGMMS49525_10420 [Bacteroidia bacterium]
MNSATITATTVDGGFTATCVVTVVDASGYQAEIAALQEQVQELQADTTQMQSDKSQLEDTIIELNATIALLQQLLDKVKAPE